MKVSWIPGAPPGRGKWWIYFRWLSGKTTVEACEVGPAVLKEGDPSARLLLKFSTGAAYLFEPNRASILFHAPIEAPDPPDLLDGGAS